MQRVPGSLDCLASRFAADWRFASRSAAQDSHRRPGQQFKDAKLPLSGTNTLKISQIASNH